jgi:cytochrome c-type biogenesis protein CcmE
MTSARTKFLIGGALVLGTAGYLMATSIRETGTYYLTPTELATKLDADPSFRNTGVKIGARVVPGSIERVPGGKEYAFRVTDGAKVVPVVYRGIAPDTFTDGVDVVVEGGWRPTAPSTRRRCSPSARRATRTRRTPRSTSRPRIQGGSEGVILVGELSLWVALLMAAWAGVTSCAGGALGREDLVTSGRRGLYATTAMIVLASLGLWTALLTHDFSLKYVASNTSANMPKVYVFAAFWGGQAGSLLFWTLILALFSAPRSGRRARRHATSPRGRAARWR